MLLRDADPEAYNRALANATGPNGARGPIQPMVLTALISLADERGLIASQNVEGLPGRTPYRRDVVENALDKLVRDRWIAFVDDFASGEMAVKLTGVLEQP